METVDHDKSQIFITCVFISFEETAQAYFSFLLFVLSYSKFHINFELHWKPYISVIPNCVFPLCLYHGMFSPTGSVTDILVCLSSQEFWTWLFILPRKSSSYYIILIAAQISPNQSLFMFFLSVCDQNCIYIFLNIL